MDFKTALSLAEFLHKVVLLKRIHCTPPDYNNYSLAGQVKTHLARHSKMGKKTRQTEKEAEKQHQGMDRGQWRTENNGQNWM